jgi:ADP-ribosylglycohydrolase
MIGAIIGDICGSVYENRNTKDYNHILFHELSRFTDDTVTMLAIADSIINNKYFVNNLQEFGRHYPNAGYGQSFYHWIFEDSPKAYNSYGNGSAMRSISIGHLFHSIEEVLKYAKSSAEVTHNHPEGIKGAQAVASCVFLAKNNATKTVIKNFVQNQFNYDLSESYLSLNKNYSFDVSCQGSVPQAIICFLESESFEDALRKAISIGGDSDTIACISCGIAEAFYKDISKEFIDKAIDKLDDNLIEILKQFYLSIYSKEIFLKYKSHKVNKLIYKSVKTFAVPRFEAYKDLPETDITMDTHSLRKIEIDLCNFFGLLKEIAFQVKLYQKLDLNIEVIKNDGSSLRLFLYYCDGIYHINQIHNYKAETTTFLGLLKKSVDKSEKYHSKHSDNANFIIELEKSINKLLLTANKRH